MANSKDSGIVSKWNQRVQSVTDKRTIWEAMVATCMHFAAGQQQIWWDKEGNMREKRTRDHEVFRVINLWPTALGIIQSRLTTNDPRWNPRKSGLENVSEDEIDAADALLQELWEGEMFGEFSMKRRLKLMIRHGWLQGGRLAYFRHDEQHGIPLMDTFSLWDTYWDCAAKPMYDKQWLDIPVPRSIAWLKEQAKANGEMWDKSLVNSLEADNIIAQSRLQQGYLAKIGGRTNMDSETVMVHQTFEVIGGRIKYNLVVPNGILFSDDLPYSNLAEIFDVFTPIEDDEMYPRPPCYDWVEPQKTINKMYSNAENYIDTHLQGRWLARDENTTIPRAGQNGQRIIADPGELTQLEMQPLPNTHWALLQQAITQFEQITGVHSESLGRMSGSADSGVAIAQLQALDQQNSADSVENFKLFLQRAGAKLLNVASSYWDETRELYRYDKKTGAESSFTVIGDFIADGRENSLAPGTTRIRPFRRLDVEIVVGQFFSKAEKRRELVELLQVYQPGSNPMQDAFILPMVLDTYDIGVGRELVRELRSLRNPNLLVAEGKSQLIAEGEPIPVHPEDPHQFLMDFYNKKAQVAKEQGDERASEALTAQAQQHAIILQQQNNPEGIGAVPETMTDLADANAAVIPEAEPEMVDPNAPPIEELPPEFAV